MPVTRESRTEVVSEEERANLRWWQQGDEEMQTVEMLERRRALRTDGPVKEALEEWWRAVEDGQVGTASRAQSKKGKGGSAGGAKTVGRKVYVEAITKVGMALMEECERDPDPQKDVAEARAEAEESWLEDAKKAKTLSKTKWLDALFELGSCYMSAEELCPAYCPPA